MADSFFLFFFLVRDMFTLNNHFRRIDGLVYSCIIFCAEYFLRIFKKKKKNQSIKWRVNRKWYQTRIFKKNQNPIVIKIDRNSFSWFSSKSSEVSTLSFCPSFQLNEPHFHLCYLHNVSIHLHSFYESVCVLTVVKWIIMMHQHQHEWPNFQFVPKTTYN